jgi:hypothetical protein
MTSSPTPNCPTRSRRLEPARRPLALAALALLAPVLAAAHGDTANAVPDAPGGRIGLSAAVTTLNASELLPSARLGGYLLQGDPGVDRRGLGLEHGVADLGWRFNDTLGAQLAVGKHGTDKAHVEAAWLQGRWRAGPDDWQLGAGRQRPGLGPVMTTAGHLDRFALVPLAKRMAVNDDWIDDGVQLGWRREGPDRRLAVDAGLWRGTVFPGAASGSVVPALHAGLATGDWALDGFVARFQPQGRGARVSSLGGGHTHVAPRCDAALTQVLCFDGTADLAGASVRWDSHQWPVSASAAGWLRRDSGTLSSANGEARYQGRNLGGWVDAVWRFHPKAEAGVRLERIQAEHTLTGPGATLLASEAGFSVYQPARRAALMLGWSPTDALDLRVEAGREQVAGTSARFVLLRLVARTDFLFPARR